MSISSPSSSSSNPIRFYTSQEGVSILEHPEQMRKIGNLKCAHDEFMIVLWSPAIPSRVTECFVNAIDSLALSDFPNISLPVTLRHRSGAG